MSVSEDTGLSLYRLAYAPAPPEKWDVLTPEEEQRLIRSIVRLTKQAINLARRGQSVLWIKKMLLGITRHPNHTQATSEAHLKFIFEIAQAESYYRLDNFCPPPPSQTRYCH